MQFWQLAMDKALTHFWAKSSKTDESGWHPLPLHMLDVAASAEVVLAREPESTRARMAAVLGLNWEQARPWLLFLIACHDLGRRVRVFNVNGETYLDWMQGKAQTLTSTMRLSARLRCQGGFRNKGGHTSYRS